MDDKENLKLQVQEYIKEVSKCENVITQKVSVVIEERHETLVFFQENDRTTLFEQYREATNELTRARMALTDMESQFAGLRQELQIKTSDMKRYTDRIEHLERELQQVGTGDPSTASLNVLPSSSTRPSVKSTKFNCPI